MPDLPTLPTNPTAIELTENHASRTCKGCGSDADWYVYLTHEQANNRTGSDLGYDEWPVNAYLCSECFRDAPRAKSTEDIVPDE